MADTSTIAEFLRRLGHRVALIGQKPIGHAPKSTVIWPVDQDDVADQAAWLSSQYHAVYANLNPLKPHLLDSTPIDAWSVSDSMIQQRTRLLIDVDAHDVPKEVARDQKDAIKAEIDDKPLIESDTGNGFGLIYAATNETWRVRSYLLYLKSRFPCVDASVHTLSRLTRVIGTPNRSRLTGERIPTLLLN